MTKPRSASKTADKVWSEPTPKTKKQSGIQYRCMADITPKAIDWLWPGRIARGKITMIAGNPGLGKSQLTANLAATVTTGKLWPLTGEKCVTSNVVFICAEDDASDTIRPRLDAAGADTQRVFILDSVRDKDKERSFSLQSDVQRLELLLEEKGDIALVIIDPITAYMGGIDSHKTADVRGVLTPLTEMASRRNVAVVCISHLNKSGDTDAMMRVTGSLAYVAAARAAFLVAKDNDDPARRLFLPMKNNLAADHTGLAFHIESCQLGYGIDSSKIIWAGEPIHQTANDILATTQESQGQHSSLEEAKDFLVSVLANGPVSAKEIYKQAEDAGISDRTLNRAKASLGIKARKVGMNGGWAWELPTKDANNDEERHA